LQVQWGEIQNELKTSRLPSRKDGINRNFARYPECWRVRKREKQKLAISLKESWTWDGNERGVKQ